jgi:PAS fold
MNNESKIIQQKFGILDNVPVGVCVLREDFAVLFWNSCLEDWTKIPRGEILHTKITDHFPHLSQPKYTSRLQQIFAGGPPTIFSSQIHKYLIPAPWHDDKYRIQQTTVTAVALEAQDVGSEAKGKISQSFYAALKNLGKPSKTPRYKFLKHSFLVLTLPGGYAQG